MFAPVGWYNRVIVVFGTLTLWPAAHFHYSTFWLYATIWCAFTYQWTLTWAYNRGWQGFANEIASPPSEIIEMFEMYVNRKAVALEDLKQLCIRYGIPREEVQPIVDRGF